MKVPGSVYKGKNDRTYFAIYTYYPDVYRAAPTKDLKHLAHVSYTGGTGRRGIDIFLLKQCANIGDTSRESTRLYQEVIDVKREINSPNKSSSFIDARNNVTYEIINEIKNTVVEKEIISAIRKDIMDFCKKESKKKGDTRMIYSDRILPKPFHEIMRTIPRKHFLQGGKQEFVPSCSLEANLDPSLGCPSAFVDGFLDIAAECEYCYASFQHKSFPKNMIGYDKKHLKEELLGDCYLNGFDGEPYGKPIKVLRLGKRVEAGSKFTLDFLVMTLETCLETGTRVVMPTKYLSFDKNIADLFRKTNSNVLFSIGWDKLERGACSYGCNNQFRLEQVVKYRQAGVNSIIYLLFDATIASTERENSILQFANEHNIPIQLLPVRITNRELALKITGESWEDLKMPQDSLFLKKEKREAYIYFGSGMLVPLNINPSWVNFIKNNTESIRMCNHNKKTTYCGRCFLDDEGFIIPTEEVKIESKRTNFRKRKREAFKKRKGLEQEPMFDF